MKPLKNIVIALGVFATLGLVIYGFWLISFFSLVPWDTTMLRPEIGTINRTINDFFEGQIGQGTIFIVVAFLFIVPTLRTLRQRWQAGLRVIIANLLAFWLGWIALLGISMGRQFLFPRQSFEITEVMGGYHNSIIPLAVLFLMYTLWLREIKSLRHRDYANQEKAKNSQLEKAKYRLSDAQLDDAPIVLDMTEQLSSVSSME